MSPRSRPVRASSKMRPCYTDAAQIDDADLGRWLSKARRIQWDYRNVAKRKGKLVRLDTG